MVKAVRNQRAVRLGEKFTGKVEGIRGLLGKKKKKTVSAKLGKYFIGQGFIRDYPKNKDLLSTKNGIPAHSP